jgi:hypothetical protein
MIKPLSRIALVRFALTKDKHENPNRVSVQRTLTKSWPDMCSNQKLEVMVRIREYSRASRLGRGEMKLAVSSNHLKWSISGQNLFFCRAILRAQEFYP